MEKKKQSALSRLMDYAGGHKYFTYASLCAGSGQCDHCTGAIL